MTKRKVSFYDTKRRGGRKERSGLQVRHNFLKAVLIDKTIRPGHAILDLACGDGGDISKYRFYKLDRLALVDQSATSISYARDRLKRFRVPFRSKTVQADLLDRLDLGEQFDVIYCQFAAHYFKDMLFDHLRHLKVGGLFVMTTTDERFIKNMDAPVKIEMIGSDQYNFKMPDHAEGVETLIRKDFMDHDDFEIVEDLSGNFIELYEQFKNHRLADRFQHTLTDDEVIITQLYRSFVLKRVR